MVCSQNNHSISTVAPTSSLCQIIINKFPIINFPHQGSHHKRRAESDHDDVWACEEKAWRGKMNNRMPVQSAQPGSRFWRAILGERCWTENIRGQETKLEGLEGLSIYLSLSLINYLRPSQLAARDCHIWKLFENLSSFNGKHPKRWVKVTKVIYSFHSI